VVVVPAPARPDGRGRAGGGAAAIALGWRQGACLAATGGTIYPRDGRLLVMTLALLRGRWAPGDDSPSCRRGHRCWGATPTPMLAQVPVVLAG
jgi:hypothetical protein